MNDPFAGRDALHDDDGISSREVLAGVVAGPFVTIAIPTYRRPDMLVDTVRSTLAQRFDRSVEILVVDNDPNSGPAHLIRALPALSRANFRYLVNDRNIGMFGNWNRCLAQARGEWVTILNDDDLLDPDYLSRMFAVLDRRPAIDGIVARKRTLDERRLEQSRRSLPARLAARIWEELRWRGRASRRFPVHRLFWGNMIGNGAGFLFRTSVGKEIGGFLAEEYPSADYLFLVRFAKRYMLHQHRAIAASVRIADNESAKRETLIGFMQWGHYVQRRMFGRDVGRWRAALSPMMMERHRVEIREFWHQDIPRDEVEQVLGLRLTRDRPWLLWTIRALLGGY